MATRKPSPAQLEARRLFAERARSGELAQERAHHRGAAKRTKAGKAARKPNPLVKGAAQVGPKSFHVIRWDRERNTASGNARYSFTLRDNATGALYDGTTKPNSMFVSYFGNARPDSIRATLRDVRGKWQMIDGDVERESNPTRVRSKAQNLAIALNEQRAGHPRKAREFFEAAARSKNPAKTTTRTTRATIGGVHYAVLAYRGKTKPTGSPDIVFPARDLAHARSFAAQLESRGFSGVVLIEKTQARV